MYPNPRIISILVCLVFVITVLAGGCEKPADAKEPEKEPTKRVVKEKISGPADKVVLIKHKRLLQLKKNGKVIRDYKVALGGEPKGAKQCLGDLKTPEGDYVLDYKNPGSKYHLSIHVSYPAAKDRKRARELGCNPGGDIFIHGLPPKWSSVGKAHVLSDWTLGCIAVTDREIEEIWELVNPGTPISILP